MAKAAILFGLTAATPLAICAGRLGLDLWYDEAYMLREYVARGPRHVASDYSEPNNHILYALLLWPVQRLSRADAALRMPNLLFAAAALGFTFLAARRLAMGCGEGCAAIDESSADSLGAKPVIECSGHALSAAAAATAALGLNTMFLVHAMQLRGYGLSMALAAALLWLALSRPSIGSPDAASGPVALGSRRAIGRAAAITLLSAALLYAIPANAVALAALAAAAIANVAMITRRPAAALVEAATWLAGMIVGLALYTPVWHDLRRHAGPRDMGAAWGDFLRAAEIITRDGRWLWAIALLGLAATVARSRRASEAGQENDQAESHQKNHAEAQRTQNGRKPVELGGPRRLVVVAAILCFGPFVAQAAIGLSMPLDRSYCAMLPGVAVVLGVLICEGTAGILRAIGMVRLRSVPRTEAAARTTRNVVPRATHFAVWLPPLVVLAALLPSKLTYAERLAAIRELTFAQDGYYCYFAADYHPEALVKHLRKSIGPGESYVFLWERSGNNVFPHYLERAGLAESRAPAGADRRGLTVYYAAPTVAELADITRVSGIPAAVLRRFERVQDFGYFRLYRMSGEEVERWIVETEPF